MRPEGRGEHDSLYFTYPKFPPPQGARRDGLDREAPVVIVGAGPVGMTAALALAAEGVASVILEARDTFNDGSRAICIARHSFNLLERLGALAPFEEKSLGWTKGRSFYRGRKILEFDMPDGPEEKFRPMYNLEQQYIEEFLWQAVSKSDLIDLRWQSRVSAVSDGENGVIVDVADPLGGYQIRADWVLAADGARSTVRAQRRLRLKGDNYEGRYVIADVRMDHDYPTIRRALFDPDCRRGGTVLIHKQPEDIWRIDYQLREDEDIAQATDEAVVRESVARVLADIGHQGDWELEWWSAYSANTLALDDYRDGRVFFIGDSAHIVPIFGVRGLNNGLADAQNIGWKLGWVITGRAGAALLDSYTPERRGATLDVFANATKSTRFMTPPTGGWTLMRDAALSLSLSQPFAGEFANPRQMTPYTYSGSPASLPDDPGFFGGPVPGAVLSSVKLEDGFLCDRMGAGFTLICFDTEMQKAVQQALETLAPAAVGLTLLRFEPDGKVAQALRATAQSTYLIRPDLHIAGRWKTANPAEIAAGFGQVTGRAK